MPIFFHSRYPRSIRLLIQLRGFRPFPVGSLPLQPGQETAQTVAQCLQRNRLYQYFRSAAFDGVFTVGGERVGRLHDDR